MSFVRTLAKAQIQATTAAHEEGRTMVRTGILPLSFVDGFLTPALAVFRRWRERSAARARLAAIGARDLRDFGISPAQADYEAAKPFWKE
jgi:uncharacterized protein YjiS (DUF1127 family)